jgi:thiamine transport system permease protein
MDLARRALTMGRRANLARAALVVTPVAFLGAFFLYPLVAILGRGLVPRGHLDLAALGDVLGDRGLREVAWFTLWQAVVSTALTLLVGLPAAFVVARFAFRGRALLRSLLLVPFVLPTVVVAAAFEALLGGGGPLARLGLVPGVAAILIAHVFFNVAVVARVVGGLWANLDPAREEAARVLGASRWRAFVSVTLPLLAPAIIAASSIVFLFTFSSFGVVLLLGGPTRATLETEIYLRTTEFLDLRHAAALAVVQIVAVVAVLVVLTRVQERMATGQRLVAARDTGRPARGVGQRAFLGITLSVLAVLLGAPLATLVARSFGVAFGGGHGGPSLVAYRSLSSPGSALFVAPSVAIRNSLLFALAATLVALVVGGAAAFVLARRPSRGRRALDTLLMLPLGTSAVTIGFGFLIALDRPPLDLRSSTMLVPLAHAVVGVPFVVRAVVPALRSIDPRLREAAAVLGAPPGRVRREVDLPIVGRAFLVAAGFAAAISLGDFGATAFIARPDAPTVPIAIFRLLSLPGRLNFDRAMALSTVLMVLTGLVVVGLERVRVASLTEF